MRIYVADITQIVENVQREFEDGTRENREQLMKNYVVHGKKCGTYQYTFYTFYGEVWYGPCIYLHEYSSSMNL